MRWVLITALGNLVEPEVNKNFAIVSGPVACIAASTAGVACVVSKFSKVVIARPAISPLCNTTSISWPTAASIAFPYRLASAAKTKPGVKVVKMCRSFSKSWLMVE